MPVLQTCAAPAGITDPGYNDAGRRFLCFFDCVGLLSLFSSFFSLLRH
jgi:hypothetical protein